MLIYLYPSMTFELRSKSGRWSLILPIVLVLLIKLLSLNHIWVENAYSTGFFPGIGIILRKLTGWIPFSFGDIIYLVAGCWLLWKIINFSILLIKKKIKRNNVLMALRKLFLIALWVYIIFNIFWGLNYNRRGIGYQLNLSQKKYDTTALKKILIVLLMKVNSSKQSLIDHPENYPSDKELFRRAGSCYLAATKNYAFLQYSQPFAKSSMYSIWGSYMGFTGYYNPFSGEAQVNTTIPKFILPYTTCHEIAHQLGYAKEDEANFVGYLAATSSDDILFHYSAYLDLFLYAAREVSVRDRFFAVAAFRELLPGIKSDLKEWNDFLRRHKSFVEPIMSWAYTKYLKANQQPKGMQTYNEVVANLIAYYKKYGKI